MRENLWLNLITMAVVTYLIRMIPLVFMRKKIENRWIRSFLFYVPYAVLGAMTFPAIFYSTDNLVSAIFGAISAIALAYKEKSLIVVAIGACTATFVVESILTYVL